MIKKSTLSFGGQTYESPEITVLDLQIEGVICGSGNLDAQDWSEGNSNWFEE